MTVITIPLKVAPDGVISSERPLPVGEPIARIESDERRAGQSPSGSFDLGALPRHDLGAWPDSLSLRREYLYGDEGR